MIAADVSEPFRLRHRMRGDLRIALERGDIDQASFSFNVADGGDQWAVDDADRVMRTIRTVGALYDVTVTARGAYPQTTMGVK
jgi:phage head maturation protease